MNNEYSKNYEGVDVFTLNYDGSVSSDITLENGQVNIFSSYDEYDSNFNSIPLEDWEEFKAFVDNQIAIKGVLNEK